MERITETHVTVAIVVNKVVVNVGGETNISMTLMHGRRKVLALMGFRLRKWRESWPVRLHTTGEVWSDCLVYVLIIWLIVVPYVRNDFILKENGDFELFLFCFELTEQVQLWFDWYSRPISCVSTSLAWRLIFSRLESCTALQRSSTTSRD